MHAITTGSMLQKKAPNALKWLHAKLKSAPCDCACRTRSARRVLRQPAEKPQTIRELVDRQELVRLVRLVDRAGSADHGRQAGALEMPGLRRVGNGDRPVRSAEPQ